MGSHGDKRILNPLMLKKYFSQHNIALHDRPNGRGRRILLPKPFGKLPYHIVEAAFEDALDSTTGDENPVDQRLHECRCPRPAHPYSLPHLNFETPSPLGAGLYTHLTQGVLRRPRWSWIMKRLWITPT